MLCSRYTIGRRSETIFIVFYFIYFFYENDSFPRQWVTIKPRAIGCATGKQKKKIARGGVVRIRITIFFEQLKIVQRG